MHDTRDDVLVNLTNANGVVVGQYNAYVTGESDDDGSPCAAACVFDGANHGVYIGAAVVDLACGLGWTDASAQVDDDLYEDDDVDRATDYLNELTPAGWQFVWDEGSFYLANDAWCSLIQ